MRTLWDPAEGYPVALLGEDVYIPDFHQVMERSSFPEAVAYICADLRRRKLEGHYFPFPSSMESVTRTMPDASVLIAPTHGWDNPGPLADTDEE